MDISTITFQFQCLSSMSTALSKMASPATVHVCMTSKCMRLPGTAGASGWRLEFSFQILATSRLWRERWSLSKCDCFKPKGRIFYAIWKWESKLHQLLLFLSHRSKRAWINSPILILNFKISSLSWIMLFQIMNYSFLWNDFWVAKNRCE